MYTTAPGSTMVRIYSYSCILILNEMNNISNKNYDFIEHSPALSTKPQKNFPYPQEVRTTAVTISQTWELVSRSSNMLKVMQQASEV